MLLMKNFEIMIKSFEGLGGGWAKGQTVTEAWKLCGKPKKYIVYMIHPAVTITQYGDWYIPVGELTKLYGNDFTEDWLSVSVREIDRKGFRQIRKKS